ncbi:MAG: MFS transporter [Phenylobacterium sp.]|uniref:spinster family MFS transporter n=1 Tax=Phenylobacterium sp. TaxID=1871053 RepID=UPI0025FFF002|nr:MFS transporter [Phenylobacterium sp.]MCG9914751.1 MFS transporter [Phenylobacterium sp.]
MTDTTAPGATNADAAVAEPEGVRPLTAPVRTYAMSLLLGIYTINFLDRQVVNILAEPIKQDLGLADWQLGLMSGLAFALFYTVLGIPIARIAERGNRPLIIGIAVAVWSGFTALCGLAQNFVQLILFRIGVGVGEAGCTPPAHSLISDYVPKEQRSTALAFYSMGTPIGGLMGLILGGLVADAYGWRIAFLVAGIPGILFAILAIFTLPEPRKELARRTAKIQANSATFGETMAFLRGQKTFWYISFAAAVKAFIGYGHAPFTASFFLRNYPDQVQSLASTVGATVGYNLQSIGFLGLALGLVSGIAGAMGSWLGGFIADKFAARDLRAQMVAPAIASVVTIPIFIGAMTIGNVPLALVLLTLNALLGSLWFGPVYGTAQSIVPPHMRATASAILLFTINLIGLGLGPLAVGLLSDYFAIGMNMGSAEGVRWALMVSAAVGLVATYCFWRATQTIRQDHVG